MLIGLIALTSVVLAQSGTADRSGSQSAVEALWEAARAGDALRVSQALDRGADINATSRYGATALMFAADKGHLEVVRLLLDKRADPDLQDTFYRTRAVDLAVTNDHLAVAQLLLERGSKGAPSVLVSAVRRGSLSLVRTALASDEIEPPHLRSAISLARTLPNAEILALLERRFAAAADGTTLPAPDPAVLQAFAGTYRDEASGYGLTFVATADQLTVAPDGQAPRLLTPLSPTSFRYAEGPTVTFTFASDGRRGRPERVVITQNGRTTTLLRTPAGSAVTGATNDKPTMLPDGSPDDPSDKARVAARPWPSFRGANAAGVADGQGAVTHWDVATGTNIKWRTAIPGMGNSSPIIWGNRVFVTTAISSAGDHTIKTGIYGAVTPTTDVSRHEWKIYCLDKDSGKILWQRTAHAGPPQVRRHMKATQANSTPVTDGRHVVALFGSAGVLAAWRVDGQPLWQRDIGALDSGWFFDPTYQWGHASSPILHGERIIVQADVQGASFIAAYDVSTGRMAWRSHRDEISSWGTPTVFRVNGNDQLVTNGTKVRGYDPATGKLLWTLGPNSEITVATPIVGDGLVYVTGGYTPVRPLYAIKATVTGEISMSGDDLSHDAVAWSNTSGTYIPTPLYYDGRLYTCSNEGILTAYDARTGQRLYRTRVGDGGAFSASPIAADGRLYLANEDGDVFVAVAGPAYREIARNAMGEAIMSSPAVSDGALVIRTLSHVYGIGPR